MVENLRDLLPDGGRAYVRLARDVGAFLEERSLRSWGQLDVETFVFLRSSDMPEAIEVCCSLAAMLPHLMESGELSAVDATGIWVALFDVCPEDETAQRYLLEGLQRFGDLEALVRAQLQDWGGEPDVPEVRPARGLSVVPAVFEQVDVTEVGRPRVLPTRWMSGE